MRLVVGVMAGLGIVLMAATWLVQQSVSNSMVCSDHASLQAARQARLFKRGWLPDRLPASTYAIRVCNDLDQNRSAGAFRFDPADGAALRSVLVPAGEPASDYLRSLYEGAPRAHRQLLAWSTPGGPWLFECDWSAGVCLYRFDGE